MKSRYKGKHYKEEKKRRISNMQKTIKKDRNQIEEGKVDEFGRDGEEERMTLTQEWNPSS